MRGVLGSGQSLSSRGCKVSGVMLVRHRARFHVLELSAASKLDGYQIFYESNRQETICN
jgi:hypothetical protein